MLVTRGTPDPTSSSAATRAWTAFWSVPAFVARARRPGARLVEVTPEQPGRLTAVRLDGARRGARRGTLAVVPVEGSVATLRCRCRRSSRRTEVEVHRVPGRRGEEPRLRPWRPAPGAARPRGRPGAGADRRPHGRPRRAHAAAPPCSTCPSGRAILAQLREGLPPTRTRRWRRTSRSRPTEVPDRSVSVVPTGSCEQHACTALDVDLRIASFGGGRRGALVRRRSPLTTGVGQPSSLALIGTEALVTVVVELSLALFPPGSGLPEPFAGVVRQRHAATSRRSPPRPRLRDEGRGRGVAPGPRR